MSIREFWFSFNLKTNQELTNYEILLIDADIFIYVLNQLKEKFKLIYKEYFQLMNYSSEMENKMLEECLIKFIINDILSTEEYSLAGIAYYTDSTEDVIYEIAIGNNTNPSLLLSRKIIELHRSVRPQLYNALIKKVISLVA